MTSTLALTEATLDAVNDAVTARPVTGRYVTTDSGALYRVLGYADVDADSNDVLYARSERTNLLVRVERTGERVTSGQVRVRVLFSTDTGDAAGTLQFGTDRIGGVAPRNLFSL